MHVYNLGNIKISNAWNVLTLDDFKCKFWDKIYYLSVYKCGMKKGEKMLHEGKKKGTH